MSKNRVFCGLCLSNGDEHVFMKISYILCIVETTTITVFAYNFGNNNAGRITYVFFRHPSLLYNVIYKNCYSHKEEGIWGSLPCCAPTLFVLQDSIYENTSFLLLKVSAQLGRLCELIKTNIISSFTCNYLYVCQIYIYLFIYFRIKTLKFTHILFLLLCYSQIQ